MEKIKIIDLVIGQGFYFKNELSNKCIFDGLGVIGAYYHLEKRPKLKQKTGLKDVFNEGEKLIIQDRFVYINTSLS